MSKLGLLLGILLLLVLQLQAEVAHRLAPLTWYCA